MLRIIIHFRIVFRYGQYNFNQNKIQIRIELPDAFCKNTGNFDFSTVPDLSRAVFRKRHRENRETISIVKPQLLICPYFGWLITLLYVCDVTIAPRIASTAINKLC